MNDPNRTTKWLVVIALVVLSLAVLYPPERKLKGGIDLVGGTSLLYEIDTTGLNSDQTRSLSSRVMGVLKKRIDPHSQLNLEWRPVGATRLEIRMPRPPKAALERRARYNETVDQILAINLKRRDAEEALGATENRETRLKALERGLPGRAETIKKVATTYDALQQAKSEGADPATVDPASKAYEAAMSELLATNLPIGRLTDVLAIPTGPTRDEQIAKLRKEFAAFDSGDASAANGKILSKAVAAFDDWAADKAELEDPSDLKRRLKGAGVLEFRILAERDRGSPDKIAVPNNPQLQQPISKYTQQLASQGARPRAGDHFRWFPIEDVLKFEHVDNMEAFKKIKDAPGRPIIEEYAGRYYVLMHDDPEYKMTKSTGQSAPWELRSAYPDRNSLTGENVVSFALNPRGGQLFGELTGKNVERQLTILLDQQAISHANIRERITEHCQISGRFSPEQVMDLVGVLEAGSLPARLKDIPLSEETIGPSLGETNRRHGMQASIAGLVLVAVFVVFYYGFAGGGTVVIALTLNLLFTIAIMAFMQATFTLPGIAGLLLSIGMAIDANVLIFERIREERTRGVPFKKALSLGYDKAFSAILDGNITVLITSIILGAVGSEEIKGFAITLGIGISISMFTALTVTRLVFTTLVSRGLLHDFSMRKLIGVPTIDWIALRRMFWPASLVAISMGMVLFMYLAIQRTDSFFDIEFVGGTSVQVDFKPSVTMSDEDVREAVSSTAAAGPSAVKWLQKAADEITKAELRTGDLPGQFILKSNALSGDELGVLMRGPLDVTIEQRNGVIATGKEATFIGRGGSLTEASMKSAVAAASQAARDAADRLRGARIQSVGERDAQGRNRSYEIVTAETNRPLVQQAVLSTLGDKLAVQRAVRYSTVEDSDLTNQHFFVVESEDHYLSDVLKTDAQFDIRRFLGGVVVETKLEDNEQPMSVEEFKSRLREVGLTPEFEQFRTRETDVFPLGTAVVIDGKEGFRHFAVACVDESLLYDDNRAQWTEIVAPSVLHQVEAGLGIEKSLSKVVQFAPQIAGKTARSAIFATILAALGIGAYVWMRFGTKEFALAVLVTLVHDVCIVLGMIAASHWFYKIVFGRMLLIEDFRFDLTVLAAVLTIIGYSLNDTIVVFDRIRETRGRSGALSANLINSSINQTMSRTILTGLLVFMTVIVLYLFGGDGIHGFAYVMLIGTIVGTYSTVAISVPLVYKPKLLYNVVTIIAALILVGIVAWVSPSTTATAIIGAAILIGAGVIMLRSNRADADMLAGQPA